jgi:hypothetical protein
MVKKIATNSELLGLIIREFVAKKDLEAIF